MRWLVIILVACLAVTVLRATIVVLLLLLALAVAWGVFFRPAETFGFFGLMAFLGILERYPLPVLLLIGLLSLLALRSEQSRNSPGCTDNPCLLPRDEPPDRDST